MSRKDGAIIASLMLVTFLFLYFQMGPAWPTEKRDDSTSVKMFHSTGYSTDVDMKGVAARATDNPDEQTVIVNFLAGIEENFKISPTVLFQNNDYLVITYHTGWINADFTLNLYFTKNKPVERTEKDNFRKGEVTRWINFNGYIAYGQTRLDQRGRDDDRFRSWYEPPTNLDEGFTNGIGFPSYGEVRGWYTIIDLREFDWRKPRQS